MLLANGRAALHGYPAALCSIKRRTPRCFGGTMTDSHLLGRSVAPAAGAMPDVPLLAKLGHELRSPLTGILGLSRIMLVKLAAGPADPDQQIRQLEMLRTTADHMLQTVDRVVEVARLGIATTGTAPEPTDCRARIAEVMAAAGPAAEARGRTLILDLPDEPVMIPDHHDALPRIVAELVDNAVKYTNHTDIRVRAQPGRDHPAVIEVSDDGPGLTEREQARVGSPFERGTAAEDNAVPGTGLGLYLAHQLADRAGLQILLRSAPPAGTTFAIRASPAHHTEGSPWPLS